MDQIDKNFSTIKTPNIFMKKTIPLFFLTFSYFALLAQKVEWSYKVLEYSSEVSSRKYSAQQAVGKPNVLPAVGQNVNAWQPKGKLKEEFIKVGFVNPIKPKQILIAESFNPGYISKILAYNLQGREFVVHTYKPKGVEVKGRLFSVNASQADFLVIAIKVFFKPEKDIPIGIDAIGITESEQPIEIKVSQADVIKSNMVATNLGPNVNSDFLEFGPLLAPDGKTLYFSRRADSNNVGGVKDEEDIWYSSWDENKQDWAMAKNMGVPLNNSEPNFINSISPDGNTMLLGNNYLPDGSMGPGVSVSYRTATGWTAPENLTVEEEKNVNEKANYFLSNTKKTLLLSIERKGDTYGERDLYVSFMNADTVWSKPLNLGKTLNTMGTEAAPFLASDERTLYFTSNGFSGYGGSDIYVTRRLDDSWTKWSEPENLGPVVNTAFDESFFTISASGNKVLFTSAGEKEGDQDMYTLTLPEIFKPLPVVLIKGRVLDSKTGQALPDVKIFFEDLSNGKEVGVAKSNPINSEYQIVLPSGANYGYLAEYPGYVSVHSNMDLTQLNEYTEIQQNLYLSPIEIGQTTAINNVFFDFNKYELKKESHLELDRLIKLLVSYPNMKVEISGHTDNIGSESYNDKLSYNRANAVVQYILQKSGIEASRVVSKYYGELNPVADNSTAWGRHQNRRVEFKIIAK